MSENKKLTTPLTAEAIRDLKAGDSVLLSGVIYTARDKAHKRLCDTLAEGKPLPVALENQLIYYVGPAPAKPGQPIGSCGNFEGKLSPKGDPYGGRHLGALRVYGIYTR